MTQLKTKTKLQSSQLDLQLKQIDQKKQKLDGYRPLAPELAENLDQWFRVELTYTSNAIEGNTLTRQETALVIEKGLSVGGKTLVEHLEASNHAQALDWLKLLVQEKSDQVGEKEILRIHEIILGQIDHQNAGRYRSVPVRISGSQVILPNPMKVPGLMQEFCAWLRSDQEIHPVFRAAEAHYHLVTIHPFVDGNGRTARLLMNLILLQASYPPAIIQNENRLAYLNSLEQAQLGGSKEDFLELIYTAVDQSLDIYLDAVLAL